MSIFQIYLPKVSVLFPFLCMESDTLLFRILSNISFDNIRFSKDGITVEKFSSLHSMIVKEGKIEKQKQKKINIKMWLDEKTKVTESSHFHGHFIIETP